MDDPVAWEKLTPVSCFQMEHLTFLDCITSGQQLLNEHNFQSGQKWPAHCQLYFCLPLLSIWSILTPANMELHVMNWKQNVSFGGKQLLDVTYMQRRKLQCTLLLILNVKQTLLVGLAIDCEQNFIGGGKSASFPFNGRFRQSKFQSSKGSERKIGNSLGRIG